ncbi:bacteriocin-like protein [Ligilactobacillus ruminis]|uniref:bacteriocin-like protein n=1 Tax=Ligilactobacillus ruminis TaxID=1623 RepID=UPI003F613B20
MENAKRNLKKLSEEELKKIRGGKVQHNSTIHLKTTSSKKYCVYNIFSKKCWR